MWATEWFLKWEIKILVDKLRDKEEEIKKLKSDLSLVIKERDDNIKQNKKLREERDFFKEQAILWRNDWKVAYEEKRKLKERIDILYEFIERNDKLVDEVIDEEDLDKLNRYIYIDDDLVDRTLESEE